MRPSCRPREQSPAGVVDERQRQHGIKCGTFGASSYEQRSIATGDYGAHGVASVAATSDADGGLAIWDLERLDAPAFSVPKAHKSIVCRCTISAGGPLPAD